MREMLQRKSAFGWLIVGTCLLLLIPFVAMQVSSEVRWTSFDFIVMGTLLLLVGFLLIILARKLPPKQFHVSVIAVCLGFLYVWAELAIGIFFSFGS